VGFDELGVVAALEHCVNEWRLRLPAVRIELSVSGDFEAMDEARGLVLYRLVQEALTNIARHSHATRVEIRIASSRAAQGAPRIELLIADNGRGVDLRVPRSGLGLLGMRERVSALGGSITLVSESDGGFKIVSSLPLTGRHW
jgi:signal transduction histidine kinase